MYKLFDRFGNQVKHGDLQDKGSWCKVGKTSEEVFIKKYGRKLDLIMNPEKIDNKYAADLFNLKSKNVGDLKTQHTPFFQAFDRFSIDAQYAVTFNENDYLRYLDLYPKIELFFWVDWMVIRFESDRIINVKPMKGVWKIGLKGIREIIQGAHLHQYQNRIYDDKGNSKESYVLDLQNPLFEKVI